MDINERINRMSMAVLAAQEFNSAKLAEYMATIKIGSPAVREMARVSAMAAYEALLDVYELQMRLLIEVQDIDPRFREGA